MAQWLYLQQTSSHLLSVLELPCYTTLEGTVDIVIDVKCAPGA